MDYREKIIIERVSQAVDDHIYEYLILPDETRIYVNPVAFEAYIKTLSPQLWAPEFRNAYDTIRLYYENLCDGMDSEKDVDTEKCLYDAANSIRTLAKTYCPEILQELGALQNKTTQPVAPEHTEQNAVKGNQAVNETKNIISRPVLPSGIKDTPGARAAFDSLVEAGYG